MSSPYFYLQVYAAKCIVELRVNEFLYTRTNAKYGASLNYLINTELIGSDNTVELRAFPTLLDNNSLSKIEDIVIIGTVKEFPPDSMVSPETGRLIGEFDFTEQTETKRIQGLSLSDLTSLYPLSESISFDNEGASFRNRFIDGPVIENEIMVRAYALRLRDLIAARDTPALFIEYRPKLEDYRIAYDPPTLINPEQWFTDFMEKDFFPGGPVTEFREDDLLLQPLCNNRVWRIALKPDLPFFQNRGDDGDVNTMEVYVGLVEGKLRIIR